ncbi:hypothetical protein B296_00040633 [Ensete ventricosum]|uniref:Uncharacterized protein n=1 Tax=Ensete ventricosum TaxID=4639 RepID=A0A426X149_ENSVE|nr:hypothetical protein B296_00040633 [Ensete ventricosum]
MAGRGATLVLRTSWFNCSSWIRAKEITAIRVYGGRAFTSPRTSSFRLRPQCDPQFCKAQRNWETTSLRLEFPADRARGDWMAVEGVVGLGMAGREATLVLHTSWFNSSSGIRAKEIAAIRAYGCCAFTSRISSFRPLIKVSGMGILEKGVASWKVNRFGWK